ncbi:hypothetical protein IKQ_03808 [Bacillus cereus VDM053]|nr:hypothetical protein IKQ_03808 [Bacillus cereus VDM053]
MIKKLILKDMMLQRKLGLAYLNRTPNRIFSRI